MLRCRALSSPGTAQPGPCLCLGHKTLLLLRQRVIFPSWEGTGQCEIQPVLLCGGGLGITFVVEGRRSSCINFHDDHRQLVQRSYTDELLYSAVHGSGYSICMQFPVLLRERCLSPWDLWKCHALSLVGL